jgi:hypothetical protein
MAVATKKSPAKKVAAKKVSKPSVVIVSEMSEARKAARARQPESRSRAILEHGVDPKAGEVVIYSLKNRLNGTVRVLVDARGSRFDGKPWIVRDPDSGAEVCFETRKALGAGYAAADLSGAPKRTVKRPARVKRGSVA